ncbi:MAG: DUF4389 domain-containing protein [Chloroflexi bacterium]|nr:DUF4389 domain-containing protein [Chloroflexota bacterium]
MAAAVELMAPGTYPMLSVRRIETPNRLWAFPVLGFVVKLVILIPVSFWLTILFLALAIVVTINAFVVLLTGRYWDAAYRLVLGILRLSTKISFFVTGLTDRYPGFGLDIAADERFTLDMPRPESPNRGFGFPLLGGIVRIVLLIPFTFWSTVVGNGSYFAIIVASVPVLFTGRYRESLFELVRDSTRLSLAQQCYLAGLSDTYPSFPISMRHPAVKWLFILLGIVGAITQYGQYVFTAPWMP